MSLNSSLFYSSFFRPPLLGRCSAKHNYADCGCGSGETGREHSLPVNHSRKGINLEYRRLWEVAEQLSGNMSVTVSWVNRLCKIETPNCASFIYMDNTIVSAQNARIVEENFCFKLWQICRTCIDFSRQFCNKDHLIFKIIFLCQHWCHSHLRSLIYLFTEEL